MSIRENFNQLMALMGEGKGMEAFEKFYAEDCVMQENTDEARVGKAANREYEIQFFSMLEAFHGMEIRAVAVDEENGVLFYEAWMDFTLKGMGRMERSQVSVQRWKNGQIIHERFYYKG